MGSLPDALQRDLKTLERRIVERFSTALCEAVPEFEQHHRLLKPVTMSLFGMLNWHYMWFRPGGKMKRSEYSELACTLILGGARDAIAKANA